MKDDPAFPYYMQVAPGIHRRGPVGLTKREYFAGLAMQGLIGNETALDFIFKKTDDIHSQMELTAKMAVVTADALLEELGKDNV